MSQIQWNDLFAIEKQKPYWQTWMAFLDVEYSTQTIFPLRENVFKAFELCPLPQVKVVILGQDPYHQPNQAHGLSFSVPLGIPLPRSLRNIYKEIEHDLNVSMNYESGDLSYLAKQGVLLINTVLTVREGQPLSHQHACYELFFKRIMQILNESPSPIVFMLWGQKAHRYRSWINATQHAIIETNHPSPLSANRGGWFNTKPFSRANTFLVQAGIPPIQWANSFP
jgi:uracil-DNA glycosylase